MSVRETALAALYTHEKQNGKALEAVKKIVKDRKRYRMGNGNRKRLSEKNV